MKAHYTYFLIDDFAQKSYYGLRSCEGDPEEDLWKEYFSSSKPIKKLLGYAGPTIFTAKVHRVFATRQEAAVYEEQILTWLDAARNPLWYNQHNGGKHFIITPAAIAKTAAANRGKKHLPARVAKVAAALRGRKNPKIAAAKRGKKRPQHVAKAVASANRRRRGKSRYGVGSSGAAGVTWERARWRVTIQPNGTRRHLGTFVDFSDAVAAAKKAFDAQYGVLSPYHGKTVTEAVAEALARRRLKAQDDSDRLCSPD